MEVGWLLNLLVVVIILAICFGIFFKYIVPQLPEPFRGVAIIIAAVIAILLLIGMIGYGPHLLPSYHR